MAINAGSVYGELILKGDQYFNTLEKAQKDIDGFAGKLKAAGDKMQEVGKSLSLKVTAPIVAIGTAGTKMALDLQNGIKKVSTLADKGILPVSKIETEVKAISNASGIAQTEISEAIYSALSAGVESENVLEFVRSGIDLTRAGFTSMETAIDATTTVLNAYGENAYDVGKIHDIFVQTQNKGKISVDELGSSIGRVIPTASSLGVNLDQLGAGYAILTAKGQNAQLATTNFNAMLGELGKTGSDTDEALRDLTGKSFKELMEGGMSVGDVLGILNEHAIENGLSLKDMFGSMNAGSAAVTLISDGVEGFNKSLDDMNNAAGKTAENAATMEDGWFKIDKAVTQVKNAMIEFGTIIAPYVEAIATKVSTLAEKFAGLDDKTKKTIITVAGIAAAIGPALIIGGQLISGIGNIIGLVTTMSGVFTVLAGPVGIAVAAIAAITTGGILLYNHLSQDSIPAVQLFGDEVSESTQKAVGGFLDLEEKATLALNQLNWSGKEVTEEMTTEIVGAFEAMKDNIITELEEQKSGALESLGAMFGSMKGMAEEEKEEALRIIEEKYDGQIEKTEEHNKKIAEIMERAKEENRALTDTEKREINEIKEAMKEDAIRILSDSEAEQLAIMERLKLESGKISALQAADVVKNSKEQKDKTIEEAEAEYKERLKYAAQLRVDGSEESQKLADKVVGAAEYQYKEAVRNAEEMHEDIVAEAKLQAGEHIHQVDWETGEIKTKWQVFREKQKKSWEEAEEKHKEHLENMKEAISNKTAEMKETASERWNEIKENLNSKLTEIKENSSQRWEEVKTKWTGVWDNITSETVEWGTNIVKGLWDGITSMTTWISDNIKEFAGKIVGPFKKFFGIESPSTLMATFGTNLVEGLTKGIDETATKPVTSITGIANQIGTTVETKWSEIETTTESKWTAVWNKTKDAWNDIATKVKDTTKEASGETKTKWDNVLQSTKSNWDEVQKKTQDTWNDVKAKITDMVKDSSDEVKSRWAEIETETNDRWGEVYDKTKETWDDIETKIKDTTGEASGETKTKWSEILKDTESNWEGVWNRTKETWEDVKAKITDMVKGSSDETQEKWSNIKTTTDENWDKIYEKTKTTWESVKTDIVDAATESEQTWSEKSDKMLNTTKTTWEDIAQHVGDNLDKVNDYVQTTTSIIEKEFELWVKQNNIVKDSSEYLAKQLEVQQEKHELLNEQIKATREALEKATEKYGEHSLEALKLQEKLLNLQLSYSALGKEIDSATDAINRQTNAMQKQIEISRENGRLSVRTDDSYFSRSSSDWYTWTDDEGMFRSGSKDDYDDYTGRSNITDSEVNRISREHGVDLGVARDMAAANERAKKKGNLPIYHWGGWVGNPLFDMESMLEKLQGMLGHDERLGLLLDGEYVLSKDILNKFRDISTGTPTPSGRTERSRGDIKQTVNIYSPTPLSPSEIARKQLQASRQLAMEWGV